MVFSDVRSSGLVRVFSRALAMIHIVLADDHAIVREGFRALIEREPDMEIAAECASLAEVELALVTVPADVLVLDISMRDGSGLALLDSLRSRFVRLRIVMMSMHEGEAYVTEAFARGADGYITKAAAPDELIEGIRAVMSGQRNHRSTDIATRSRTLKRDPAELLTTREREVFLALAQGRTPKQVAAELGISVKTAYVHRANVLAKLVARDDRELYRVALEGGWLGT